METVMIECTCPQWPTPSTDHQDDCPMHHMSQRQSWPWSAVDQAETIESTRPARSGWRLRPHRSVTSVTDGSTVIYHAKILGLGLLIMTQTSRPWSGLAWIHPALITYVQPTDRATQAKATDRRRRSTRHVRGEDQRFL